jgi:hypothetical protein
MLLVTGFQNLAAQEGKPTEESEADRTLEGQVVDAKTGAPLVGAFVQVEGDEWGVLSEADGSFSLPDVASGTIPIVVEQLGYKPLRQTLEVGKARDAVTLGVEPDSALLEGINLAVDRLERRRHSAPTSSWAFTRKDLLTQSALDALTFIKTRTPARLFPCSLTAECVVWQGRAWPVTVWVDEMPFLGGLDYLRSHQPYDLQRIEVFGGGRQVRVYTAKYLTRVGKTRVFPDPFIL